VWVWPVEQAVKRFRMALRWPPLPLRALLYPPRTLSKSGGFDGATMNRWTYAMPPFDTWLRVRSVPPPLN
jgi:hypothetical protein